MKAFLETSIVFVSPETGISQVSFFLDDPSMSGPPRQVENNPPYDFAGTARSGEANLFDTITVIDGSHVITALISLTGGETEVVSTTFTVQNNVVTQALLFSSFPDRSSSIALESDISPLFQ